MSMGKDGLGKAVTRSAPVHWGWRVAVALILMIPLLAASGGRGAVAQDEAGPLKIAVLFPFTGDLSDFGPPFLHQRGRWGQRPANRAGAGR